MGIFDAAELLYQLLELHVQHDGRKHVQGDRGMHLDVDGAFGLHREQFQHLLQLWRKFVLQVVLRGRWLHLERVYLCLHGNANPVHVPYQFNGVREQSELHLDQRHGQLQRYPDGLYDNHHSDCVPGEFQMCVERWLRVMFRHAHQNVRNCNDQRRLYVHEPGLHVVEHLGMHRYPGGVQHVRVDGSLSLELRL